ncbi:hypothetical protein Tco_0685409 [Tanacetum coccineum]
MTVGGEYKVWLVNVVNRSEGGDSGKGIWGGDEDHGASVILVGKKYQLIMATTELDQGCTDSSVSNSSVSSKDGAVAGKATTTG